MISYNSRWFESVFSRHIRFSREKLNHELMNNTGREGTKIECRKIVLYNDLQYTLECASERFIPSDAGRSNKQRRTVIGIKAN